MHLFKIILFFPLELTIKGIKKEMSNQTERLGGGNFLELNWIQTNYKPFPLPKCTSKVQKTILSLSRPQHLLLAWESLSLAPRKFISCKQYIESTSQIPKNIPWPPGKWQTQPSSQTEKSLHADYSHDEIFCDFITNSQKIITQWLTDYWLKTAVNKQV